MSMAPLETARLRIREFEMSDLETYHRLKEGDWFENEREPIESTRDWLEWTVRNYRELEKLHQPPYGDYVSPSRRLASLLAQLVSCRHKSPGTRCLTKTHPPTGSHHRNTASFT